MDCAGRATDTSAMPPSAAAQAIATALMEVLRVADM